jgi:hypothetical protein|tara:strand:- start:131 stop:388 length:258 start_codon:yes stop_codon:yes gene_type:complete
MTGWYNKKIDKLTDDDKFEMIKAFADSLGELYQVIKNDDKKNIVLIIGTLVDTFSAVLLGGNYKNKKKKVRDIELTLNEEIKAIA